MARRTIDVVNELYLSLETHGHQVKFSPHGQRLWRRTVDEREKVKGGNHNSDYGLRHGLPWCSSAA